MTVLHAATAHASEGDALLATGGRVLSIVGTGPTLRAARARAYEAVAEISLEGSQFRTDIAQAAAE